MEINLQDFWESYLSKTEVNTLGLKKNPNIEGPIFDDEKMYVKQRYEEQKKSFVAEIDKKENKIEMKIHDDENGKNDIVVRGQMFNEILKKSLDIINYDDRYKLEANHIIITIKDENTLDYEYFRKPVSLFNEETTTIIKFLLDKELQFIKNDLKKIIKKNDIYFIQITENTGRDAVSMPTDYPHLDLCAKDRYRTNLNKFCGVSSILYTNVTDKTSGAPRIYPSASFFYGPEIPMQTEDFRFLEKKVGTTLTPIDLLCPNSDCTNFFSYFYDKDIVMPMEFYNFLDPLKKEENNELIAKYLHDPDANDQIKNFIKAMTSPENMLSLFQKKMKRIFVSAPMMTSGWAVWKNEPSRMKKIDWETVKQKIERGEQSNVSFDDEYILNIRKEAPTYYTHTNVSKDSVWHISPHKAIHNPADEYTKPCTRKFVTLRFSNFNIYAAIRFILIPKENIRRNNSGKTEEIIDKIYKDIIISNLQVFAFYYINIKRSFPLDLFPMFSSLLCEILKFLKFLGIDDKITISDTEKPKYFDSAVDKIEKMTEVQCRVNNVYKKFNSEGLVNGRKRETYSSGLDMIVAYIQDINGILESSEEGCVVEVDDDSDVKLEDYYFKQKYLKYKSKYLNLLKSKKLF